VGPPVRDADERKDEGIAKRSATRALSGSTGVNQKGDPQNEGALPCWSAERGDLPGTGRAQWTPDGEAMGIDL